MRAVRVCGIALVTARGTGGRPTSWCANREAEAETLTHCLSQRKTREEKEVTGCGDEMRDERKTNRTCIIKSTLLLNNELSGNIFFGKKNYNNNLENK